MYRTASTTGPSHAPVFVIEVQAQGREFWELNNPEDVPRIEAMMRRMGLD